MESYMETNDTFQNTSCSQKRCYNYKEEIHPFTKFLYNTLESLKTRHENSQSNPVFYFNDWSFHYVSAKSEKAYLRFSGLEDVWRISQGPIFLVGSGESEDITESTSTEDSQDQDSGSRKSQGIAYHTEEIIWCGQSLSSEVPFIHGLYPLRPVEDTETIHYVDHHAVGPVHINVARYISSLVKLAIQNLIKSIDKSTRFPKIPALLFKCDNSAPEYVAWLFSGLELCSDDNGVTCNKKTFITSHLNPGIPIYRSLSEKLEKGDSIHIFKRISQDNAKTYFARYGVHNSSLGYSKVFVDFCWQGFSKPFAQPPAGCNTVIQFKAIPQNTFSVAYTMFEELVRLFSIADSIMGGTWPSGKIFDDVEEKVKGFVKHITMERQGEQDEGKNVDSTELNTTGLNFFDLMLSGKDIDFTDDLWLFLKDIGSYESVRRVLEHIFTKILSGVLQPVVASGNKTTIAEFLRDFYRENGAMQDIKPYFRKISTLLEDKEQLLGLVTEIGIQKLKSDYIAIFQNMEVATQFQLERVIGDTSSFKRTLNGLLKLHYSLEIMLLAKMQFTLTDDLLRTLSKSVFDYYSVNDPVDTSPTFALSVPSYAASATSVHKKCFGFTPNVWKCCVPLKHKVNDSTENLLFVYVDSQNESDVMAPTPTSIDTKTLEEHCSQQLFYTRSSTIQKI